MFEAEADLPKQVASLVKKTLTIPAGSDVLSIVLFGSMARGTARIGSDLDLLIVVPASKSRKAIEAPVDRLRARLYLRFNVPLSPYIQTLSELRRKHRRKLPLIREIVNDGRTISGKDIKELLA